MDNEKISKAKEMDIEATLKCFRRCDDGTSPQLFKRLSQERLEALLKEGELFIIKENKRVHGAIYATSLWEDSLFPQSRSFRKSSEVLEGFPYRGERIVYIDFLFIDPSSRGKGRGKRLMDSIFHRYEKASFLLLLEEGDPQSYFESFGFVPLLGDYQIESAPKALLYVKPYTKTGICSDPAF